MRADVVAATSADARVLAELRYEFRSAITPPREGCVEFVDRCERWMAKRLRLDDDWWAWLAVAKGGPVGTVWLHRIDKLPNPVAEREAIGYVTSFFVREEARGHGIGTALLRAALAKCDALQFDSVILWPTPRSRALYERHGFAVRDEVLLLKL